jgi:hypothetical protein
MPTLETLRSAFAAQTLFADKTWQLSPAAFPLDADQLDEVNRIGAACHAFYHAQELLYQRSAQGRKILRNGGPELPWIAEYLDRGKPDGLVAHGRHKALKNQSPVVLRPDLLITENGFALTEMDSVPGGIGLTAFLNELYSADANTNTDTADAAADTTTAAPDTTAAPALSASSVGTVHGVKNTAAPVGAATQPGLFYRALAALTPANAAPRVAIVVSDEAATYRPEFEWLAATLRARGHAVHTAAPEDLMPLGGGIFIPVDGNPERVDIIYRFFELFDLGNVKGADAIFDAVEAGQVVLTPPMKAYQEEKMNLALLHHPALDAYWREALPPAHLATLRRVVPRTWIMENVALPPVAVLHAPAVNGRPICAWADLANASQKERNLILKASGFHEDAWGARSVTLGSDVSRDEWLAAIEDAIDTDNETFYVMQDYHKPRRLRHPVYLPDGTVGEVEGRARLCPYFFVINGPGGATVEPGAILATLCPADKKIIHGMKDAMLLPVRPA